jgi:hypothetical protein
MKFAKFECEDCGEVINAEVITVFENGVLVPPGKKVMRGDKWYDAEGQELPPMLDAYRIDHKLTIEPFCPHCVQAMQREMAAPAFKSDKSKATDSITKGLMAEHGLTDMKDSLREGDTAAPKIRPDLAQAADNMFKKQNGDMKSMAGAARNTPYEVSGRRGMSMLQTALKNGRTAQ